MMIFDIVNVLVTSKIKNVNVYDIATRIKFCDYIPKRFAAATIHVAKSKTVNVNIYKNHITSTGANKKEDAISAILDVVDVIAKDAKVKIEFLNEPKISNITVTAHPTQDADIVDPIILARFKKIPFFSNFKTVDNVNGATMMISKYGKITITGTKSLTDAIDAVKRLLVLGTT